MSKAKIALFVDVQNDFVKGGALAYKHPSEDIVPKIVQFAKQCRAEGYLLAATQDTHWASSYPNTLEGRCLPVLHCEKFARGWRLAEGLAEVVPEKNVFEKSTFGLVSLACELNALALLERKHGIEEIRICGGCTSICVAANALILRATLPDVRIVVEAALCFDVNKQSHFDALSVMRNQMIEVE